MEVINENNPRKKVFVSYSHQDLTIVSLIVSILKREFDVKIDRRDTSAGMELKDAISELIFRADVIIVVVSTNSMQSHWVHQEIGVAKALNKVIMPVVIDKTVPKGIIRSVASIDLQGIDAFELDESLIERVRRAEPEDKSRSGYIVIEGREPRAESIIDSLKAINIASERNSVTICKKAVLSVFSLSDDPVFTEKGDYTKKHLRLLLDQKDLLEKLINNGAELLLVLSPEELVELSSAEDDKYYSLLLLRLENLLKWINYFGNKPNVKAICRRVDGTNTLVVDRDRLFIGYHRPFQHGFGVTLLSYNSRRIEQEAHDIKQMISRYDGNSESVKKSLENHIKRINELQKK